MSRTIESPRARRITGSALVVAAVTAAVFGALEARSQDEPSRDPAAQETTVLRIGTLAPEGTPWAAMLERFKEHVETATRGELRVRVFLNGRQGDEPEMLDRIAQKKLQGGGLTATGLARVVPEISVLEVPFLFNDDEEADHVMDRVVREDMARLFEAKGLHLYVWAVNGWIDFGSTKRPILRVSDVQASKPYERDSRVRTSFWRACGARPQVLAVPEVRQALADEKVDLYMTTPLFAAASQWHEKTRHWTDSNHVHQPAAVVFDLAFWRSLPAQTRRAIESFAPSLQEEARKGVRGLDASILDGFRAHGVALHTLAPAEREAMRRASSGVATELIENGAFTRELYESITGALERLRKERGARPDPVAAAIAEADRAYAQRPAIAELGRGLAALEEAVRADPRSFEAAWRMSRMLYYMGKHGPDGSRIERYQAGIEWGKKAVALNGARVEGHFWLGVLYGVFGEAKGISSSLFLLGDMREALGRANAIDPRYEAGGPPRILGRLYFKLPWAAGGSNAKAIEHLRTALRLGPAMPMNHWFLAEVLIDEDENAEAERLLAEVTSMKPGGPYSAELAESQEMARNLLEKLK